MKKFSNLLQFVIVSLTGWGLLFYSGYKFFTKGKSDKKEEVSYSEELQFSHLNLT